MTNQNPNADRRKMLRVGLAFVTLPSAVLQFGCASNQDTSTQNSEGSNDTEPTASNANVDDANVDDANVDETNVDDAKVDKDEPLERENIMKIQYLEFVTSDVDAVCATYSQIHGVTFGESDPSLGGARTAQLADGGMLGVRAPMRETEAPVVRPYFLTNDIEAAVAAAKESGAEIAIPPMPIEGHGTFAIFIQNGIESGLWQL